MTHAPALVLAVIGLVSITAPDAAAGDAEEITGRARAITGDTLEMAGRSVLLAGIQAPDPGQTCTSRKGETFACGDMSRRMLARRVKNNELVCKGRADGGGGQFVAVCKLGMIDLNELMVAEGWAGADPASGARYMRAETFAKARNEGLWKLTAEPPWAARRQP